VLHHRIIAGSYHLFAAGNAIGRRLGLVSPASLRVLHYHDVAPQEQDQFAEQLRWLAKSWKFVSAEQFAALILRTEPVEGRHLLLAFDDGYASNRRVAEEVLKPLGIRALFFAVSDFVSIGDRDEARQFIAHHIQPGISAARLPAHLYNMGWSDLEALLEQGHTVGCHTQTHPRLSEISAEGDLEREIVGSADTLARRLGVSIEHFAYTFGDIASFSQRAFDIARRRFRYIYSGLRGDNAGGVSPLTLRRDAATPNDRRTLLGAYLEGAADFRYARARAVLSSWM
jgi:peptidoglycan/xylan/chitin deacetylase (PgdA/CDA1 family)